MLARIWSNGNFHILPMIVKISTNTTMNWKFVYPQNSCWILTPNVMELGGRGLREVIRSLCWSPRELNEYLYNKDPKELSCSLLPHKGMSRSYQSISSPALDHAGMVYKPPSLQYFVIATYTDQDSRFGKLTEILPNLNIHVSYDPTTLHFSICLIYKCAHVAQIHVQKFL